MASKDSVSTFTGSVGNACWKPLLKISWRLKSSDFPFCLCWANENWSRRWDGLDSEILIAQKHSPEDDLAFIQIRCPVHGGSALHPHQRPAAAAGISPESPAVGQENCRVAGASGADENGLGELYLAYTQSFEAVNPARYGFDAAIEFPPNNTAPPDITDQVKPLDDQFAGTVYRLARICGTQPPLSISHPIRYTAAFARHGTTPPAGSNHGVVFQLSSPLGYQQWLYNAIEDTCNRFSDPDERLIFINAWNEWAESAYLEPDQRRGYAYLEATRMALVRSALNISTRSPV
jgi:hypothetical protein